MEKQIRTPPIYPLECSASWEKHHVESCGKQAFPQIHIFNFQKYTSLKTIFGGELNPQDILQKLSLAGKTTINPNDLVSFDGVFKNL
ncbi:hypothetical protein WDW37_19480 [Bdellovibrionota bacterium FG-1]